MLNKIFGRNNQFTLHLKIITTHQEAQKNLKCASCEKSLTQPGSLKVHIKTVHEGQRNYKCDTLLNQEI